LSDWTLYTDGGSRGNPGKSSAAYAIFKGEEQITIGGEFLGITTNSQAEYHSLRIGLEAALARNVTRLVVKMDNLMVVNQINGTYTVKNRELWPIYAKIKDLIKHFEYLKVEHIRREFNTIADREVNRVLDEFVASDSLDV
jgi:ribonuclease HI